MGRIVTFLSKPQLQVPKTFGIEMKTTKGLDDITTVIWDLAGDPQFRNSHQVFLNWKF